MPGHMAGEWAAALIKGLSKGMITLGNCRRQIHHDPTYLWDRESFLERCCGEGYFLNNSFSNISYFSVGSQVIIAD